MLYGIVFMSFVVVTKMSNPNSSAVTEFGERFIKFSTVIIGFTSHMRGHLLTDRIYSAWYAPAETGADKTMG